MAVKIIMPKMGESITEGTIIDWKKSIGDTIDKDETLLEISTDKVDTEVPSPASGVLLQILKNENETVDVGSVIGYIGEEGEKFDNSNLGEPDLIKAQSSETKTNAIIKSEGDESPQDIIQNSQEMKKTEKFYSPLVRSIAKREGLQLSQLDTIKGSGKDGRVNKSDILHFIDSISRKKSIDESSSNSESHTISSDKSIYDSVASSNLISNSSSPMKKIEEMDSIRKKIAKHMIHSKRTSAHVYSTVEIDMTNLIKVKDFYKKLYMDKYSIKLTITALIIDACIKALNDYPLLNTSIDNENIIYHNSINMGVAVSLDDNNLIVPVMKSSEELNLIGICRSLEDLSYKARNKQLSIDEVQGSTFTITNPGVFGGLFGMPIINQPNVAILAVGKIQKKPIVKETEFGDSIFVRSMMYATLGYDHRLIDGAYATKFLSHFSDIVESYNNNEKVSSK